jgi:DNA polymerase III subunit delta
MPFTILYGADAFAVHETVERLRARLVETDPVAELNRTELDGRALSVGELQSAADALPFLGERRLVIVRGLLAQATGRKELAEPLMGYLPRVPPTTRLVLAEGALAENHRVLAWARRWRPESGDPALAPSIRRFDPPAAGALPGWLARRAGHRGGALEPAAATALAEALLRDGSADLFQADGEIEKLLTYAGDRAVTADDVARLVAPVSLESVFRLIDALGDRDGARATSLLHRYLDEGEHPLRLLALIVRQFRQVTRARALLDAGTAPGALAGPLGVPPFAAGKLAGQARRFPLPALAGLLARLLDADAGVKTGRIDAVLALDLFVADVCRRSGR